ncbi:hypothetical protein SAMN06265337_4141 [Hymenobacter gelipurpurascens]|uniref:P-type conjugative transfer protein TrbJ n=1 Tax=Hymenobacter gelipurpurascens TaxID=89968 RepID=A0A212UH27_9BACT|nr:hypothetical protein [Hymenobacter gelipurpurascens]SNC77552.1 hypothetical protein SAMN06265337_4141 [Hymenobacter gelipurpurascens]
MKKIVQFTLLVASASTVPFFTSAQMVVNDPVHMGVHIGQFAKQLKQWGETIQNYQVIKDARQIAGVTRDITGEVKNITGQTLLLQRQIQADLRKVESVKDLRYANPLELFSRALAMNTTSQPDYMPPVNKARRLRQALQGRTEQDVETVYQAFSGLDIGRNGAQTFTYRDYKNMRQEAFASAYAYEEVLKKKNVETAFNYQKIADEMTAQSVELMATLKNPGRYSMTEAERLRAMGQANENMVKALQLRQEADRLIHEAGRPGPARQAVEGAYRDQLLQNQLLKSISRSGRF